MKNLHVENMTSRNGNDVPNQFIITIRGEDGKTAVYFQSYNSVIAKKEGGKVYLDSNYWDYSRTTGKYRNEFLGEDTKTTRKKIESGEYELVDLNN